MDKIAKNVPTDPAKWSQAKAQARAKFDVYPSAYANGWAAKKYKEMGGGWKKEASLSSREYADDLSFMEKLAVAVRLSKGVVGALSKSTQAQRKL